LKKSSTTRRLKAAQRPANLDWLQVPRIELAEKQLVGPVLNQAESKFGYQMGSDGTIPGRYCSSSPPIETIFAANSDSKSRNS